MYDRKNKQNVSMRILTAHTCFSITAKGYLQFDADKTCCQYSVTTLMVMHLLGWKYISAYIYRFYTDFCFSNTIKFEIELLLSFSVCVGCGWVSLWTLYHYQNKPVKENAHHENVKWPSQNETHSILTL